MKVHTHMYIYIYTHTHIYIYMYVIQKLNVTVVQYNVLALLEFSTPLVFCFRWYRRHGLLSVVSQPWFVFGGITGMVCFRWYRWHGLFSVVSQAWFVVGDIAGMVCFR